MQCKLCGLVMSRRDKMATHLRSLYVHGLRLLPSARGRPVLSRDAVCSPGGDSFGGRRSRSPPVPRSSPSRRSHATSRRRRESRQYTSSESDYSVSPRRGSVAARAVPRPLAPGVSGALSCSGVGVGVVSFSGEVGAGAPKILTASELAVRVIPAINGLKT